MFDEWSLVSKAYTDDPFGSEVGYTADEVKAFSQSTGFLDILIGAHLPVPVEELVAASLRQMSVVYEDPRTFLVAAGKQLAVRLGSDFNRLRAILERLS